MGQVAGLRTYPRVKRPESQKIGGQTRNRHGRQIIKHLVYEEYICWRAQRGWRRWMGERGNADTKRSLQVVGILKVHDEDGRVFPGFPSITLNVPRPTFILWWRRLKWKSNNGLIIVYKHTPSSRQEVLLWLTKTLSGPEDLSFYAPCILLRL